MCGRAAQNATAVENAVSLLSGGNTKLVDTFREQQKSQKEDAKNTINMSPGQSFVVIHQTNNNSSISPSSLSSSSSSLPPSENLMTTQKIWGLITKSGTSSSPLPRGPSQHFSNLMFNARSETAAEKPSFRPLISNCKTCLVPLNGFYEWKTPPTSSVGSDGRKQPYYVHRSDGKPLLVAGLYTSVSTGDVSDPTLHTFSILTTSASAQLSWLHHRMPVFIWDHALAQKWLTHPNSNVLDELAKSANTSTIPELAWHPVTKKMSKVTYDGMDSNLPIQLEKVPSIKSFFTSSKQCPAPKSMSTGSNCNNSSKMKEKQINTNGDFTHFNPYKKNTKPKMAHTQISTQSNNADEKPNNIIEINDDDTTKNKLQRKEAELVENNKRNYSNVSQISSSSSSPLSISPVQYQSQPSVKKQKSISSVFSTMTQLKSKQPISSTISTTTIRSHKVKINTIASYFKPK